MKKANPHRPIVLSLADAAAIHRWLEFVIDGRSFFNPIESIEAHRAAESAMLRLGEKLIVVFGRHEIAERVQEN